MTVLGNLTYLYGFIKQSSSIKNLLYCQRVQLIFFKLRNYSWAYCVLQVILSSASRHYLIIAYILNNEYNCYIWRCYIWIKTYPKQHLPYHGNRTRFRELP